MTKFIFVGLSFLITVSACGTLDGTKVRQQLGLVGQPPDEFLVTTRKPLEIPTSTTQQLALPQPASRGTPSRVEIDPLQQASDILIGRTTTSPNTSFRTLSATETQLLQQSKSTDETQDIRRVVDQENAKPQRDKYLMYRLFPGLKAPGDRINTLDPRSEAERLRQKGITNVPQAPVTDVSP